MRYYLSFTKFLAQEAGRKGLPEYELREKFAFMNKKTSRITAFYQKSHEERLLVLKRFANLSSDEVDLLRVCQPLDFEAADKMLENAATLMPLPLGIATNFLINGKEYLIPMAIEEPSVIAAACNAARLARPLGGFFAEGDASIMMGQIPLVGVTDCEYAKKCIHENRAKLIAYAHQCDPLLVSLGGGIKDIQYNELDTARGRMLVVHLFVDVKDAMGANIVNAMAERIAPSLELLSGGSARLKIISNLACQRMVRATATWSHEIIDAETIEYILDAYAFAQADCYRATTHNKGIMNGIDAIALATGNDFRAIESGVHAWACRDGSYQPVTHYAKNEHGDLVGSIEIPLAVGIVGGIITRHPIAQVSLKILGVQSAAELAQVMAAVGLAQNFAALRALVTEGIQKGHMKLHHRKHIQNKVEGEELV